MLSCVQLFVTTWTVAHRLVCPWGFSRQEYWSELLFPSPGDLSNPGIEPRSPALQADSLPSEPPGKPKNTGVGCHFLLQGIFPSQGLNPDLLHCRKIIYKLSYSPWNSPGQNITVDNLSLLQEIFPTQGSNPCLLHCRRILY